MKYKILVADDSPAYLRIIERIFKVVGEDYSLVFAEDGKKAYEMAISEMPDLILLDIIMPEINGIQVLKQLKENKITRDIPIIVLSASESLKAAFEAGATDYITKPFKHYELLIRVRAALNLVEKIRQIQYQKDRIEKQHNQVLKQKKEIEVKNLEIIQDMYYSQRIQNAILPTNEFFSKIFSEHFVFNLPKNIIGGDFYLIDENNGRKLLAVADCTGHGISGAFMTIAGTAFLKEIINKYKYDYPHEILNLLREKVMLLLQQKGIDGEASDGMDIALCVIDKKNKKLMFSGANNPVYIVKNSELKILKGDRMPIGIHRNFTNSFNTITIDIKTGDLVYLFSDGYADQFGGELGKKFRYKNFQNLILDIANKTVEEQKIILEDTFYKWKNKEEQVDDILVVGVKIKFDKLDE